MRLFFDEYTKKITMDDSSMSEYCKEVSNGKLHDVTYNEFMEHYYFGKHRIKMLFGFDEYVESITILYYDSNLQAIITETEITHNYAYQIMSGFLNDVCLDDWMLPPYNNFIPIENSIEVINALNYNNDSEINEIKEPCCEISIW